MLIWHQLQTFEQIQSLVNVNGIFAVFKHSTRCSVSSMAKSRLERSWPYSDSELPVFYIDVIGQRELSNKIAETTGIRHESPQLIVWNNGLVSYHASHISIAIPQLV